MLMLHFTCSTMVGDEFVGKQNNRFDILDCGIVCNNIDVVEQCI